MVAVLVILPAPIKHHEILTCDATFLAPPTTNVARNPVNFAMAVIIPKHCAANSLVGVRINPRMAVKEFAFLEVLLSWTRPPPL